MGKSAVDILSVERGLCPRCSFGHTEAALYPLDLIQREAYVLP
jgi:hypothetical protein